MSRWQELFEHQREEERAGTADRGGARPRRDTEALADRGDRGIKGLGESPLRRPARRLVDLRDGG